MGGGVVGAGGCAAGMGTGGGGVTRGRSLGGMRFSPMHANFLVNEGRGTAMAALDLVAKAREAVKSRFGVELELEVRVVR